MKRNTAANSGLERLLSAYRNVFRIPENLNHYNERDFRIAERKFVKYALKNGIGI
jgi:hypothetical protein